VLLSLSAFVRYFSVVRPERATSCLEENSNIFAEVSRWNYRAPLTKNQCGVKVMKSDIKEIKLQIWKEVISNCVEFEDKKDQVVVILRTCRNMQIAYRRNSKEGIILRNLEENS
jgi:hypothetical protein